MLIKESEGSTIVLSFDFGSCCLWTSFPFNTGTLTKLQRKSVEPDVRIPFFRHADSPSSFPSVSQQTKIIAKTRVGKKIEKMARHKRSLFETTYKDSTKSENQVMFELILPIFPNVLQSFEDEVA